MENEKKTALEQPLVDEFSRHKKQKIHKDKASTRSDHKHDYSIEIVLINGYSHLDLVMHGYMCSICGRKDEMKFVWGQHIDHKEDVATGIIRVSEVGMEQLHRLFPNAIIIHEQYR